jgi:hypothetical protein
MRQQPAYIGIYRYILWLVNKVYECLLARADSTGGVNCVINYIDDSEAAGLCRSFNRPVDSDHSAASRSVYHHKHTEREAMRARLLRE